MTRRSPGSTGGHTALCSEKAVALAAERGLLVCGHLMAGLPGEREADFLASVEWAASLPLRGLKLHNVYVPENTALAVQYRAGAYHPLDRDEYVDLLCAALPRIPSRIVMHRLQSDPAPGELAGPAWAGRKRPLITDLLRAMRARDLWQGCAVDAPSARRNGSRTSGCFCRGVASAAPARNVRCRMKRQTLRSRQGGFFAAAREGDSRGV